MRYPVRFKPGRQLMCPNQPRNKKAHRAPGRDTMRQLMSIWRNDNSKELEVPLPASAPLDRFPPRFVAHFLRFAVVALLCPFWRKPRRFSGLQSSQCPLSLVFARNEYATIVVVWLLECRKVSFQALDRPGLVAWFRGTKERWETLRRK